MIPRRSIPVLVGSLTGFCLLLDYFLNIPLLSSISREIQSWPIIVSAFLLSLGMINLILVNVRAVRNKRADYLDTGVLLFGMIAMFIVTLFDKQLKAWYDFMFYDVYAPTSNAVYSLLMYSTACAAFRGLRAKSLESAIFLLAAAIAMLGVAPVGEVISKQLPVAYNWILTIPNMAGQRGITISAAIGAMSAGLRVLLGIERRAVGAE